MTRYNEVMEHVRVTPDMRERVLRSVATQREVGASAGNSVQTAASASRAASKRQVPRWVPLAAAACLVLAIGVPAYHAMYSAQPTGPVTSDDSYASQQGVEDCTSLAELEQAVGFPVPDVVSALPFEAASTTYTNVFGIARVGYTGADGQTVTLSKGVDDGTDVSGNSNEYASTLVETISGVEITRKGSTVQDGDNAYALATWTQDGYGYAVDANPELSDEQMTSLVQEVIAQS